MEAESVACMGAEASGEVLAVNVHRSCGGLRDLHAGLPKMIGPSAQGGNASCGWGWGMAGVIGTCEEAWREEARGRGRSLGDGDFKDDGKVVREEALDHLVSFDFDFLAGKDVVDPAVGFFGAPRQVGVELGFVFFVSIDR